MSEIGSDGVAHALRTDLLAIAGFVRHGEKVLDLGCGDGALLRYLIDTRQITGRGVELSESGVLECVRKGLSVRQGNIEEGLTDYPNESFDTVILSQTLPYIDDPSFIVRETLRVGKRAIVSFANWGHWRCRLGLLTGGKAPMAPGLPQPWFASPRARPLSVKDFIEFCAREKIETKRTIYLQESDRTLHSAGWGWNLRAAIAIFELQ
jgi:methionine biosynthesis protein MetW